MRKEVIDWLEQAKGDLMTATNSFKAGNYYASVFFCHQSVEKALKALYIHVKKELLPKTRSLAEIGELVAIPKIVQNISFPDIQTQPTELKLNKL
jgi:HEPN domain-containing protein